MFFGDGMSHWPNLESMCQEILSDATPNLRATLPCQRTVKLLYITIRCLKTHLAPIAQLGERQTEEPLQPLKSGGHPFDPGLVQLFFCSLKRFSNFPIFMIIFCEFRSKLTYFFNFCMQIRGRGTFDSVSAKT